ncbi:MAG: ABC transporter ATP-binding protein [Xanthobacteraceae bacterium]|nr:ABC transporter ATP-binding protein [Xanthobacteraceae bacterium]PWB65212.1 MAG: nitrate ABC transporter ATP-binding protein [Bradyrhizobiaceae bacterium]
MRLVAERIGHGYGALDVLSDISFSVADGEIVAVVGPSGCGKSTLLRILGGLERPRAGRALIEGTAPPGSLNPITFVFQDFALLPWRTVAGNVALVLEDRPLAAAERREMVAGALARMGLADFADAYPKQLSGGMRQRVGLARALVVRPAVLLMDEPLSALDAQTRELLMDDLTGLLAAERFAGVYVTHNLGEAVRLARRILVMSRRPGRVRSVVEIARPIAGRSAGDAELAAAAQAIWESLREEAVAADRELADG